MRPAPRLPLPRPRSRAGRWQRHATPSLDPLALAVWERMPADHQAWARRAVVQGVVAEHPHHARILADLGVQYRGHRRRTASWVGIVLLTVALLQLRVALVVPDDPTVWVGLAIPAVGGLALWVADRSLRRTIRANQRRAEAPLVVPAPTAPDRVIDLQDQAAVT